LLQLVDLPEDCQAEIKQVIATITSENVVDELASRAEQEKRSMIMPYMARYLMNHYLRKYLIKM
jgi:uncharacterized protein YgiB involved in biofilm formation